MLLQLQLLVTLIVAVQPTAGDAPFELVLGLPLQRLDELEAKFWAIADPQHADYLKHMTLPEVRELIGASAADVTAATGWLKKLGASRCSVSTLGDTVVGEFEGEGVARASGHWHHWAANADGVWLPQKTSHTHPLHYVLRRDRGAQPKGPVDSASCQSVLTSSCSTDAAKAHSPFASEPCGVCAGKIQHQLRVAGCTDVDIRAYCHAEMPRRKPYDITAQKEAYQMPINLTATNPNTMQMVWGPGTFGFGRGGLEGFRDAHCPLLNVDKVRVDGFHGKAGGDNYGEGNLDTQMIASFGLNVTTLVSNTNTSASTEEGVGFGQAMLDFITSLAARPVLPHVLSLSLGSLSPHSCGLLCSEAEKRGHSLAACRAYLQTQRQVCMFIDEAQTARIDTALQVLGVRGVSVLGSSGDGGSHWSFQAFDAEDPMGAILNDIGCKFMFPIYPSPSPYMISIGGTQWKNGDPSQPEMWDVGGSGAGGGFAWQWPMPDHQKDAVRMYLGHQTALGQLPPPMSFNSHGRGYPDISAVAVEGTSQSSPTMAGMFSMITDHRLNKGLKPLGFFAPRLWAAGSEHPGVAFEDVLVGNTNTSCKTGFAASEGWDPATGWGRPIWPGMLEVFGSD